MLVKVGATFKDLYRFLFVDINKSENVFLKQKKYI